MSRDQSNMKDEQDYSWTTWEELLLACAVKRHGFKKWESVAMEVQTRTSLPNLEITAEICQRKYQDLRRRFTVDDDNNDVMIDNEIDSIPWLEDLRKLRVAELKQEVQRYDVSILNLQSKVKRLENDREESLKADDNCQAKPDLDDSGEERSETDKNDGCRDPVKVETEQITGKSFSGENVSVNGSNSTAAKGENREICEEDEQKEEKPVQTGSNKPDLESRHTKAVVEDSCNGSSEPNRTRKGTESDSVRDSAAQSKESSDVQSSASLTRKEKIRRRKEISGGDNGGEEAVETGDVNHDRERTSVKSEPLVSLLEAIKSHKNCSLFDRRLKSQESDEYKNTVKQHMDLGIVKSKLEQGLYSSSDHTFYRDLLLIFSNAIAFFSKSSLEYVTACELRNLVFVELHKLTQQTPVSPPESDPSPPVSLPRSDSLLAKHKSSVPILVCRKRSSITTKPSSASLAPKVEEKKKPVVDIKPLSEDQSLVKEIEKEKSVTGSRSLRRSSTTKKPVTNPPKTEKRKNEEVTNDKKKSAADFLKRIKRNSAVDSPKKTYGGDQKRKVNGKGGDNGSERVLRQNSGGRKVNKPEGSPSKKNVGRPAKKEAEAVTAKKEAEAATVTKRGRESGGTGVSAVSKRPKKRSRR